ncbi:hypothetical protein CRUP_025962 [Coryphaenoides rupestris]|nr:hypothetical protein CRUP_025962 [Coryphaenoides rupestris]
MAEWTACMDFGVSVAKQASQVVLDAFKKEKEVMLKSSPADLVTETDQRSVCMFPFVAISIAFAVNKQTEFGIVYSCVEDKLYCAHRGQGAFLNGVPLHTSKQEDVNQCLVVTEIGSERDDLALYTMTSNIMRLLQLPVHGVRAMGTAAVDMCLVATGGADVYYHIGMHCWDIAASAIIVHVNQCLVVTEIGSERDDLALYTMTSNIMRLLQLPVHGVRAMGTAAVDMCLVATGGADVYYHIGMHCWDIAASAIIVREAGGVVIDTDGES